MRSSLKQAFHYYEDEAPPRIVYDKFFKTPLRDFAHFLHLSVPRNSDFDRHAPFHDSKLMKAIGDFTTKLNRMTDLDNQINIFIPEHHGRDLTIYADNVLALSRVCEHIREILDAYVENRLSTFNPRTMAEKSLEAKPPQCKTAFLRVVSSNDGLSAEKLKERYLRGVSAEQLTLPDKDTAYASFDFDVGHLDRSHMWEETSDDPGARRNSIYFLGEKPSLETQKAFAKHWSINRFEGEKAKSYQKLKTFLQSILSVAVTVCPYSPSRVELRGTMDNVALSEIIGKRAVPLMNEGKKFDKEWLENALVDAKRHFALRSTCETLGIIPTGKPGTARLTLA